MKVKHSVVWLLLLTAITTQAQVYTARDNGIKAQIGNVVTELRFYTPEIIRITKSPVGGSLKDSSLVVIADAQKVPFSVKEQNGNVVLKSAKLTVGFNLFSGEVSYETADGEMLLQEKGNARLTPGKEEYAVSQSFNLDKEEAIYGLGQTQSGLMSQRGITKYMVQGNVEDFIPFIQSVKGYGLYWDNASPTTFSDKADGTSFTSEVGQCVDYYFMYGGNADGVVAQMRILTGDVPMLPLWTYGYWQSKERYKSQKETVEVVKKYRDLKVPLDGIIQDWQYWGHNYLWNGMEFMNPDFSQPQKMMDDIHALNAHAIISIWSSFGPQTKPYRELDSIGALFNIGTWPQSGIAEQWPPRMDYPSGVRVYDAYNPAARDIYWKYVNKYLFSIGMDGWWMDSTEPDHLDFKPEDMDTPTYLGSFRKVRNAYPLMSVGGVYDHQRAVSDSKRVFILTRSAFAGQQRYGANTWTGDVTASWNTLRNQISAGLNFSLCGNPNWNTDIGGFFLSKYPKRLNDPDYRELYVRWLQFGTFCPMMRSHGADAPREIYQFGEKGTPVYDAIESYIRMRYWFLPYIYSTSWDVAKNRSTMMRALAMDFPEDKAVWNINDEYMFGRSILVAPVTQSVGFVADSMKVVDGKVNLREVYLPAGADWYEMDTHRRLKGGQTVVKQASPETALLTYPVYVRAGSILPMGPDVQYATEKKWNELTIAVLPGADATFTLYEDEGDNYNYEKGAYSTIRFSWNDKSRVLTIFPREGGFEGMLKERTFKIKNLTEEKSVKYTGKKLTVKF